MAELAEDLENPLITSSTSTSTIIISPDVTEKNYVEIKKISKENKDLVRNKEPVNIVFCGHVDAGKSTIGGQLMYLTGQIEKRTLERYQTEARERSRESWYLSWALDTNEEERERGKTIEVGRAWFETQNKHVTILDAPGHQCFVPNMIVGAAQADFAILVVSARRGEFETGFERGGQTREHAMLVKTAAVRHLIVLVNKMDDPTVNWDQTRYDEICQKLTPFLKQCGFKPNEDIKFMPCSGITGAVLKQHPGDEVLSWYRGPTFLEYLDSLTLINRNIDGPFRMPIVERYRDMGVIVLGKVESGYCRVGDRCLIMPNGVRVEVMNIYNEDIETNSCVPGENVRLKLRNVEEEEISFGSILCDVRHEPCHIGRIFEAQIVLLSFDSIISPGYVSMFHLYATTVEVQLKILIAIIDRKTGTRNPIRRPFIRQDDIAVVQLELCQANQVICMEKHDDFSPLGRFTLRNNGRTVAIGKILRIIN